MRYDVRSVVEAGGDMMGGRRWREGREELVYKGTDDKFRVAFC